MKYESLYIEIDGQEAEDFYPDLLSLEVELDCCMAAMFRLRLPLNAEPDGSWSFLDDERLVPWKEVTVKAGFEGDMEELIVGYITHINPVFEPDTNGNYIDIWGMDGSVRMDRDEKLKDWPNKKDSDIATEILSGYGFTPEVEDTQIVHDEAVSTIIQRETDMRFLRRLALRNGFKCYVEGTDAYFRQPPMDTPPQPILAYAFEDQSNLKRISIRVNVLQPADTAMFQVDRLNKEILSATVESSQLPLLGETDAKGFLPSNVEPAKVFVSTNAVTGQPEMEALCQSSYHHAEWFVVAEGEIAVNIYGHILKVREPVTIKGVGETYSGMYFVAHVTHSFTAGAYSQTFKCKRNALKPMGAEDFAAASELF